MGYRSDVKLILTDKGMEMLKAKVPEPTEEEPDYMAEPIYDTIKIGNDKYWLLEWEDVKWYDDWEDYKVPCAVSSLMGELRKMDEPFQFMRVGEAYEDVEVECCYGEEPMPYIELKREMEVEYQ